MSDNVLTYTGQQVATDQNTSSTGQEQYQIIKLAYGPRDTNTFTLVAPGVGLPTADDAVRRLLELILLEMRIHNEQIAVLTGRGQLEYPENQRGL